MERDTQMCRFQGEVFHGPQLLGTEEADGEENEVERIGQSLQGSQGHRKDLEMGESMPGLLPGLGTIGRDGLGSENPSSCSLTSWRQGLLSLRRNIPCLQAQRGNTSLIPFTYKRSLPTRKEEESGNKEK